MVLPGIQALFGFQLIAVSDHSFHEKLSEPQQFLHLAATRGLPRQRGDPGPAGAGAAPALNAPMATRSNQQVYSKS